MYSTTHTRNLAVVTPSLINRYRCFLERETLSSLLSTGKFHGLIERHFTIKLTYIEDSMVDQHLYRINSLL